MNKEQLIVKIARKKKMTYKEVADCLDGMIETLAEAFESGNDVTIAGLGIFRIKKRSQTKKVLPNNGNGPGKGGEKIVLNIPEKKHIKFSLSSRIKLNKPEDLSVSSLPERKLEK